MMPDIFILQPYGTAVLLGALCMDFFFGDPETLPHPVRLMGLGIERGEPILRAMPVPQAVQGAILTALIVITSYIFTYLIIDLFGSIWPPMFLLGHAVFIYMGISVKCLANEARQVARTLVNQGLDQARRRVSRIVGRDTDRLEPHQVLMAAIESVAENLVDAVASPLFFAALGGGPLCMSYKAVNTLDSMIGYKNKKYLYFGRVAARLDDLCNLVPARIAVLAVCLASPICRGASPLYVWKITKRDGGLHDSPNSGLLEAAFAAALGLRLAGPGWHDGRPVERPYFHPEGRLPETTDVTRALRLLNVSTLVMYVCVLILGILFAPRGSLR